MIHAFLVTLAVLAAIAFWSVIAALFIRLWKLIAVILIAIACFYAFGLNWFGRIQEAQKRPYDVREVLGPPRDYLSHPEPSPSTPPPKPQSQSPKTYYVEKS